MFKYIPAVIIFFAVPQIYSQAPQPAPVTTIGAAASADSTTPTTVAPAPPAQPVKTPVDRVAVESTFQSFYLAHLTLTTIKATAKAKGHSEAEIAKLTPQVYWKIIDGWVQWLNNSNTSAEDLLEVRTLFNSTDGKKYKKVFDPQTLPTAYNQQILSGVTQVPADAPDIEDIKAVATNTSLGSRLLALVTEVLKKNSRPANDPAVIEAYTHLRKALAVSLHKEGFTKASFKTFRTSIEQPGVNRFFLAMHERLKGGGFELITSQVPAKK